MNIKQAAKYAQIKAQLMAMSFDWIAAPKYTRNGETVYQSPEVFFAPLDILAGDAPMYILTLKGPVLCLVNGNNSYTIGFISEFNTTKEFVIKQAEEIDTKVRSFFK